MAGHISNMLRELKVMISIGASPNTLLYNTRDERHNVRSDGLFAQVGESCARRVLRGLPSAHRRPRRADARVVQRAPLLLPCPSLFWIDSPFLWVDSSRVSIRGSHSRSLHCSIENGEVTKMKASDVFQKAIYEEFGNYTSGKPYFFTPRGSHTHSS